MGPKRISSAIWMVWIVMQVAVSSSRKLPAMMQGEMADTLSDSVLYTCKGQNSLRRPICSCNPSCNRYEDCCIDMADVAGPRERYVCTQLEHEGRYVWARASCRPSGHGTAHAMKMWCEGQFRGDFRATSYEFLTDVPSFHKPTKTLYRNVYCLECNGGRRSEAYRWDSRLEWVGSPLGSTNASTWMSQWLYNPEERLYWMKKDGAVYNAAFQAAEFKWDNFTRIFNTTECTPVVGTCPQESDHVLRQKCALYAAYYVPNGTA